MTKRELLKTIDSTGGMMGGGRKAGPTLHLSLTSPTCGAIPVPSAPFQTNHQKGLPDSISHFAYPPRISYNRKCVTQGQ